MSDPSEIQAAVESGESVATAGAPTRQVPIVPVHDDGQGPGGVDEDTFLAGMEDDPDVDLEEELDGEAELGEDDYEGVADTAPEKKKDTEGGSAETPAHIESAQQELLRDGWDKEIVSGLTNEQLLVQAHKVEIRRNERDREFSQAQKNGKDPTPEQADPTGSAEAPVTPAMILSLATPLVAELGLDETGSQALGQFGAELVSPLVRVMNTQQATIKDLSRRLDRADLKDRFPEVLGDSKRYAAVTDRMDRLGLTMEEACELVDAPRVIAEGRSRKQNLQAKKGRGRATSPTSAPKAKQAMSAEDREQRQIELIEAGRTAEAERLGG